jgi:hypothetical protein
MIVWMLGMYVLALTSTMLISLIKKFAENIKAFFLSWLQMVFFGLDYYGVFKITILSGAVLIIYCYNLFCFNTNVNFSRILSLNFKYLKVTYLDSSLQSKVEEANASDLS